MTKYTGMIVWTGEGTLLDTAGPHHTLTIQKKYIYDDKKTSRYGWSMLVTRTWDMVQVIR